MSSEQQNNSRIFLAIFLILFGLFWFLKKLASIFNLPVIQFENILSPIRHFSQSWGHFIFSWQMILIIVGIILLAGKRQFGIFLIVLGVIFILPRLFFFSGLSVSLLFPAILVAAGIAIVVKRI